jgi:alpha-beta hydrolase superfamily lysophospholipase
MSPEQGSAKQGAGQGFRAERHATSGRRCGFREVGTAAILHALAHLLLCGGFPIAVRAQTAARATAQPETLQLETSDGVQLAATYYPPVSAGAGGGTAPAAAPVAILLHDLDGSQRTVTTLATGLQQRGIAVVAPDLRGHGGSLERVAPGAGKLASRSLKRPDFEAMARSRGGRIRDQAAVRGDVEAVAAWIREQAATGTLDADRLFVIGSGLGAAVALAWTVEDAAWPPIATGPQGRTVRGLVLISPAWTTRGFTVASALRADVIARGVPIFILAGAGDKDAVRMFEQLQRSRPESWYEKRADASEPTPNPDHQEGAPLTLYLIELGVSAQGDALTALPPGPGDAATLVSGFISTVAPAGR